MNEDMPTWYYIPVRRTEVPFLTRRLNYRVSGCLEDKIDGRFQIGIFYKVRRFTVALAVARHQDV